MAMDVVDYEIKGAEMQFVEIELDPGESGGRRGRQHDVHGRRHRDGHGVRRRLGGSRAASSASCSARASGWSPARSLFTTVFTNRGSGKLRVAFARAVPGQDPADGSAPARRHADLPEGRVPVRRARRRARHPLPAQALGRLLRRRGLHHAAARRRRLGVRACRRHPASSASCSPGETLHVDTGCIVAFTPSVSFEIQYVGKIKTALFGGEGLFFAKVTGPGTVWLQSLPFSRLASRVFAAAPQRGGSRGRARCSALGRRRRAGRRCSAATTSSGRPVRCRGVGSERTTELGATRVVENRLLLQRRTVEC